MTLDEIARILQAGHVLQCETRAHNAFYQYRFLLYQISYVEGEQEPFIVLCMAGQRPHPTEYQLWQQSYETLEDLEKEQPFDLNRFGFVTTQGA